MISKDSIEKEARDSAVEDGWQNLSDEPHQRASYLRGFTNAATKYAEKLNDLIELYDTMSDISHRKQIKILELEEQLAELKSWHDYYKERAEKGEGILKSATDIHFIPGKEGDNLLASKDRELAQLRTELKESEDTNFHMSADLTRQDWKIKKLEAELAQLKEIIKTVIIHLQQFDTQEWFEVFGEDKFRPYKILNKLQDAIANKLELK